jgi:hypothetical protein
LVLIFYYQITSLEDIVKPSTLFGLKKEQYFVVCGAITVIRTNTTLIAPSCAECMEIASQPNEGINIWRYSGCHKFLDAIYLRVVEEIRVDCGFTTVYMKVANHVSQQLIDLAGGNTEEFKVWHLLHCCFFFTYINIIFFILECSRSKIS